MIAALLLALVTVPPGTLVDRVVAVVDKQVITQSELLIEARVALAAKEGEQVAAADLDAQLLERFLGFLIDQMLISAQARRFGVHEVSDVEVEEELARFATRFRSPESYQAFLRRFDISEEMLRNILQRNLRNDRYIRERMRLRLLGSDSERGDRERYEAALASWLAELRGAAEIRRIGPQGELELQETTPPQ